MLHLNFCPSLSIQLQPHLLYFPFFIDLPLLEKNFTRHRHFVAIALEIEAAAQREKKEKTRKRTNSNKLMTNSCLLSSNNFSHRIQFKSTKSSDFTWQLQESEFRSLKTKRLIIMSTSKWMENSFFPHCTYLTKTKSKS